MNHHAASSSLTTLDVVTIGRSSVDLYGQQIGSRLEDVASFSKSLGGCPSNIAVGGARLGLKTAVITGVGDEQMGRFLLEQFSREGVETQGVKVDPNRLTALVILAVRDDKTFPLIFYRENCADMALTPDDVDPDLIARAKAIVVTGTHFSRPNVEAMQRRAMTLARENTAKIIFDIDYRPNLWGLAGHAAGESRFVADGSVTERLQTVLPHCDLIVGTEEEFAIVGGHSDPLDNLRAARALTKATLVLKRGPLGCAAFDGPIPATLDEGVKGPGFSVEVYNVLGAGDAFMSGFLRGWLRGEKLETCCAWANACGAFAVSRLLCSPEIPTFEELQSFLKNGSRERALRKDENLNHIHWATTRRARGQRETPGLMALACDHRAQFEELADRLGVSRERIAPFKRLALRAAERVAQGRPGFGVLLDGTYGREALFDAAALPHLWVGRPVETPGSRPLTFEAGEDLGVALTEWPVWQTVKALAFHHPDDPAVLVAAHEARIRQVFEASRSAGRECLIEVIASKTHPLGDDTIARVLTRLYDLGVRPDWWKLEPQKSATAWAKISRVIDERDPHCRGVVLLGLEAPQAELAEAFHAAARAPAVKGFAVGRTIFAAAAEQWLRGDMDEDAAVDDMAARFAALCEMWTNAAEPAREGRRA